MKLRAALSNAGCLNLEELRASAVIELTSPYAGKIVGDAHDITMKDTS
jgi:hypothetical protein